MAGMMLTCLFVLCTIDPALAQTTASGTPSSDLSQRVSHMSPTDAHNDHTAKSSERQENAVGSPAAAENAPSGPQQVSTPPQGPREQAHLVQTFLDDRLVVWQQRLKLQDWRISIVLTPRADLKAKTLGGIRWDKTKKSAVMWVLDPADYRLPFREMLDDMEFTIVHELVHLELASLPRSEASRSTEEYAVNGIADALLGLDRKR
jgi:hypothetical protein